MWQLHRLRCQLVCQSSFFRPIIVSVYLQYHVNVAVKRSIVGWILGARLEPYCQLLHRQDVFKFRKTSTPRSRVYEQLKRWDCFSEVHRIRRYNLSVSQRTCQLPAFCRTRADCEAFCTTAKYASTLSAATYLFVMHHFFPLIDSVFIFTHTVFFFHL